jgi:glutamate racemase
MAHAGQWKIVDHGNKNWKNMKYLLFILICFCTFQLNAQVRESNFDNHFLNQTFTDSSNFYHIDCSKYPSNRDSLPIGVFDSDTGGLTVLHALIDYDQNDNLTKSTAPKGDGIADFMHEQFIYFGDQANMPYGNYAKENKTGFLKQLIYKDALFLMGTKYFQSVGDSACKRDKQPVKLIVIACNTATAYGKSDIEAMIEKIGCKIKVIGVIDAGIRGALENFGKIESGTIAVMATAGTVQSNGYPNAFRNLKEKNGYTGNIDFIQQGGSGIAEAIDEEPNYIDRKSRKPRSVYKGPDLNNNDLKIERKLMQIYQFDTILPYEIIKRFQSQIPSVFQLMQQFNSQNKKTTFLSEKDRL